VAAGEEQALDRLLVHGEVQPAQGRGVASAPAAAAYGCPSGAATHRQRGQQRRLRRGGVLDVCEVSVWRATTMCVWWVRTPSP
jgi:hypothetical protein